MPIDDIWEDETGALIVNENEEPCEGDECPCEGCQTCGLGSSLCCVPKTLTVMYGDSVDSPGFCPCLGPDSFTITWEPANSYWFGSGSIGGTTMYFKFSCAGDTPGTYNYVYSVAESNARNEDPTGPGFFPGNFTFSALTTCDPYLYDVETTLGTPFCCGGGGFAHITISE